MNLDLFGETTAEAFEERAAIRQFDGLMTREQAEELALLDSEAWREACEVRYVALLPDRQSRLNYLADVVKKRGEEAGARLRSLVEKNFAEIRKGLNK